MSKVKDATLRFKAGLQMTASKLQEAKPLACNEVKADAEPVAGGLQANRIGDLALTVEELKALPAKEWVWVEVLDTAEHTEGGSSLNNSSYCRKCNDYMGGYEAFCSPWSGSAVYFVYEDYGKTWVAYMNQPVWASERRVV